MEKESIVNSWRYIYRNIQEYLIKDQSLLCVSVTILTSMYIDLQLRNCQVLCKTLYVRKVDKKCVFVRRIVNKIITIKTLTQSWFRKHDQISQ